LLVTCIMTESVRQVDARDEKTIGMCVVWRHRQCAANKKELKGVLQAYFNVDVTNYS